MVEEDIDREIAKLDRAKRMLHTFMNNALQMERDTIIQMNVEQHTKKGIDSEGGSFGEYAETTKLAKKRKGQKTGHITLEDTETFHENFTVAFYPDKFSIRSTNVSYSVYLRRRFTDNIYGLTKANIKKLRKLVLPFFFKQFNDALK